MANSNATKNNIGPIVLGLGIIAGGFYAASKLGIFESSAEEQADNMFGELLSGGEYYADGGGAAKTEAANTGNNWISDTLSGLFGGMFGSASNAADTINQGYNYDNPSDEAADMLQNTAAPVVLSESNTLGAVYSVLNSSPKVNFSKEQGYYVYSPEKTNGKFERAAFGITTDQETADSAAALEQAAAEYGSSHSALIAYSTRSTDAHNGTIAVVDTNGRVGQSSASAAEVNRAAYNRLTKAAYTEEVKSTNKDKFGLSYNDYKNAGGKVTGFKNNADGMKTAITESTKVQKSVVKETYD